ncbi:hypothetical protein [Pseudooctadecabacter jejudonensis]|uniref:Lipoprotein n=1 Tax=Pseudooctadecabacter jejudonensis TaxID=1391910 RepID=A0A1Y5SEJ3_9RHOB|nr:hypothetical protein [Pseudooctadecabacter jejudonensis]SLN36203.1 hypothetical protein PSJ8397_01843 [Pseudooctadecabacter jejudonensis]
MRILAVLAGVLTLGACSVADLERDVEGLRLNNLTEETRRAWDEANRDLPFDRGTVFVIANEHGDMHTYSLRPCGGGHICGGAGHRGHVERTADYFIVTGAYPHRTFLLSPGGDGYLTWRGVHRDLAWN